MGSEMCIRDRLGGLAPSSLDTMMKTIRSLLDLNDEQFESVTSFRMKLMPVDCEVAPKFHELSVFLEDIGD